MVPQQAAGTIPGRHWLYAWRALWRWECGCSSWDFHSWGVFESDSDQGPGSLSFLSATTHPLTHALKSA